MKYFEEKTKRVRMADLFKDVRLSDQEIKTTIQVPNEMYKTLLAEMFERGALGDVSGHRDFVCPPAPQGQVRWLRIARLPLHPDNEERYDLLYRWQTVLTALHSWGYPVFFLLLRTKGETHLYLGARSAGGAEAETVLEQICQAVNAGLPGVGIRAMTPKEAMSEVGTPLLGFTRGGAVTGIPSFRKGAMGSSAQTLDQLAFGLRDINGTEHDYAMLVIAEPMSDDETAQVIDEYRALESKIHTEVNRAVSNSASAGSSESAELAAAGRAIGGVLDGVVAGVTGCVFQHPVSLGLASVGGALGRDRTETLSSSAAVTCQYLDTFAKYAEELTQKHVERLQEGRSFGFWNAGVYLLAGQEEDIVSLTGLLRSIYAGQESYIEPLRTHLFRSDSNALNIIRSMQLLPGYLGPERAVQQATPMEREEDGEFHPTPQRWYRLGECFQYVSTPVNTRELSLFTSLPRRDVPGLRFTKTAVRFANNAAELAPGAGVIDMGRIVDMGVEQSAEYRIDVNALVRHATVAGSTGSGKSTTCRKILRAVIDSGIPSLIIEPAKDEYVRWALEQNERLPAEKRFVIYMPGLTAEGAGRDPAFRDLALNPFQPAAVKGRLVDYLAHCETLASILSAALPSDDVLPTIIDEAVFRNMGTTDLGAAFSRELLVQLEELPGSPPYPMLSNLTAMANGILDRRPYAAEVRDNLKGCLETRFGYLTRGTRGRILDQPRSTPWPELFDRNVVINVSRIGSAKDKALVMALILQCLYEYRRSQYDADPAVRERAQKNELLHLTVVEEAHNLLRRPPEFSAGAGDPQQVVAEFFSSMLSEIRAYGQGMMIVDQIPTRLIEDAIKNTNYKITHRLSAPDDCEVMASSMALREDQTHILASLAVGNAILYGDQDDAAVWVKVRPD